MLRFLNILAALAVLFIPAAASAQTRFPPVIPGSYCLETATNGIELAYAMPATGSCPAGARLLNYTPGTTESGQVIGICGVDTQGIEGSYVVTKDSEKAKCLSYGPDAYLPFYQTRAAAYRSIGQTPPGTVPPGTTGPVSPPGTGLPDGRTPGGSGTSGGSSADCGTGFTKEGPLCVPNSPFSSGLASKNNLADVVSLIISYLLYFAGIFTVIFIIIGGYQYLTARGNESQAKTGGRTLSYAVTGLVLVLLSYIIVSVVTQFITGT